MVNPIAASDAPAPDSSPTTIALVCPEAIHDCPQGLGIRFLELFHTLSPQFAVTLFCPPPAIAPAQPLPPRFDRHFQVVIVHGAAFDWTRRRLAAGNAPFWVVDLYDPFFVESLHYAAYATSPSGEWPFWRDRSQWQHQLQQGDFFLAASAAQRLFYLGALMHLGRLQPTAYRDDPQFARLMAVAPFGSHHADVPPPPRREDTHWRGRVAGLGHDDFLIFFGGFYDWYDPLTLLAAVRQLLPTFPQIRVIFCDAPRAADALSAARGRQQVIDWANQHQLLNRVVFLLPWFPYPQRHQYLRELDLAVCLHHPGLETDLSFRTRLVDYLRVGLPLICTTGGGAEPHLQAAAGTQFVSPHDPAAVADCLAELITSPRQRHDLATRNRHYAVAQLAWETTLAPLLAYCANPHAGPPPAPSSFRLARDYVRRHGWRHTLGKLWQRWRGQPPASPPP